MPSQKKILFLKQFLQKYYLPHKLGTTSLPDIHEDLEKNGEDPTLKLFLKANKKNTNFRQSLGPAVRLVLPNVRKTSSKGAGKSYFRYRRLNQPLFAYVASSRVAVVQKKAENVKVWTEIQTSDDHAVQVRQQQLLLLSVGAFQKVDARVAEGCGDIRRRSTQLVNQCEHVDTPGFM
eukprot:gene3244-2156_t